MTAYKLKGRRFGRWGLGVLRGQLWSNIFALVSQITLFAPPADSFTLHTQFQALHEGPAWLAAANQLLCRATLT